MHLMQNAALRRAGWAMTLAGLAMVAAGIIMAFSVPGFALFWAGVASTIAGVFTLRWNATGSPLYATLDTVVLVALLTVAAGLLWWGVATLVAGS